MIPRGHPKRGLLVALVHLAVCCCGVTAGRAPGAPPIPGAGRTEPPTDPGVVYTASLPREVFRPDEAIPLTLKIENRSPHPVTIWFSGFWPNHRVVVSDDRGKEPPLTSDGKARRDAFAPDGGSRDKNSPHVLGAGKTHQELSDLNVASLYRLGPGRYRVQATYHDLQGPTPLRVTSNAVSFEIEK